MLRYEMPVVYYLLRRLSPPAPLFEPKFKRYLEEYARDGVYCKRGKRLTPDRLAYYESIRRKKLEIFIRDNRKRFKVLPRREAKNGLSGEDEIKNVLKRNYK